MSITVRQARPSDVSVCVELWQALHREHEHLDDRYRLADDAAQRWATDARDWTRSPTSRLWLGVAGGTAVGLLTAHLYVPAPTFREQSLVHIDDLYVAPASRGSGLGTRLLDAAQAWAVEVGADHLRAGVLASNAAGRAFWARHGAADYSVTVTLAPTGAATR